MVKAVEVGVDRTGLQNREVVGDFFKVEKRVAVFSQHAPIN